MYITSDLAIDNTYFELWEEVKQRIANSDDLLKENYVNLNPSEFVSLPVLIDNNKIICFSGLQINIKKWGEGIARCSSRMWIDPEYRFAGLQKFTEGDKFLNSFHCLPIQLKKAHELNLDCLFISRHGNPRAFKKYGDLVNSNLNTSFKMLKHKYNVCGSLDPIPESCKQHILIHFLTDKGKERWDAVMANRIIKEK